MNRSPRRGQARLTPEKIAYTIKRHHRARTLRLRVFGDGTITVTIPRHASLARAEAFVLAKRDWLLQTLSRLPAVTVPARPTDRTAEYHQHHAAATARVQSLLDQFAPQIGVTYRRLTVRNQRTCWGSCSRQKTLSFNYRLVLLPLALQEYIVVHELCHLREMNHSRKFWALVKSILPDYTERRARLRLIDVRALSSTYPQPTHA